jgi:hypothetical protein
MKFVAMTLATSLSIACAQAQGVSAPGQWQDNMPNSSGSHDRNSHIFEGSPMPWPGGGVMGSGKHSATGDADLDRAMDICDSHAVFSGEMYATLPPSSVPAWSTGYEDCSKVLARWEGTQVAMQLREKAAQDQKDRDFLKDYVGRKP